MKAFVIRTLAALTPGSLPLEEVERPVPVPGEHEILIEVSACGVCHTELDEIEGRTAPPQLPVVPGHQVVGQVAGTGSKVKRFKRGDRVGIAWFFSSCGNCEWCLSGRENLCPEFKATGRDADGGYAEFMTVPEESAYPVPDQFTDPEAAPLLCAGAIGYRSLRLAGISNGQTLGLSGFGASGHLVLKLARHLYPKSPIWVFARSNEEQDFARKLGASWAGSFTEQPPQAHAIIDTTPAWKPVIASLGALLPGGRLVINAIRKENGDQPEFLRLNYPDHLWLEKEIKSVANITRQDVREFLEIAAKVRMHPQIEIYPFERANEAILDLKFKPVRGAKVLVMP